MISRKNDLADIYEKNYKVDENWEMGRIERSNCKVEDHITGRSFTYY